MKSFKTIFLTLAVIFSFIACKKQIIEDRDYVGHLHIQKSENYAYFHQWNIQVFVENSKNNTINVTIKGVQFDEEMPAIDIKITGIITKKTKDGFTLSVPKEGIIPTDMTGATFQQLKITELNGIIETNYLHFIIFCGEYSITFDSSNIC